MSKAPYRPSWIDRLTDWIDRLPVPNPVFYLLLYLLAASCLHIAVWLDGEVDWGRVSPEMLYNALWAIISLGVIHFLDGVGARSMERFGVLLEEDQAADLEYRLTTMPARPVLALTIPAMLGLGVLFATSPDFVYPNMSYPASWVLAGAVVVWSYSFTPILVYFLFRHLLLVSRAFSLLPEVSVFHHQPLYGLSRLPFATGLAFLVIINVSLLDVALRDPEPAEMLLNVAAVLPMTLLAFAAFLVPLLGIHSRLKREKERILDESGRHLEQAQDQLHAAVRARDASGVENADKALSSLYRVRDEMRNVGTWPWAPGTVRSFLSAVFIPMVVWSLQLFGDRIF
jgi:hypothetical protein